MVTIIPEEDVSTDTLKALFERAFFKAAIDDDGGVYLSNGLEFPIWVRVDEDRKLIDFLTFLAREPETDAPFSDQVVNGLNASVVLPTFYVRHSEPHKLYARYHASFEDGVIESQVVWLARRFAGACLYGARSLDGPVLH